MKKIVPWCVLGFALLATAIPSRTQTNAGDQKAVADLERQWLKSQQANNPDAIAGVVADGFINTGSDGKVSTKAEMIADQKKTKYTSVDYVGLKVMVFGDTAVAVANFRGKGTDSSGKAFDVNERFTDTWAKMPDGKWQCVASHQSEIKSQM
ncbi:MAG TPA: nuclear transport factor 2 family protein [Candidatus Acidoferrales bacterium]|nr:nuclear transport factor 2 family protein [Candidatus Acidoferrales bacterium]